MGSFELGFLEELTTLSRFSLNTTSRSFPSSHRRSSIPLERLLSIHFHGTGRPRSDASRSTTFRHEISSHSCRSLDPVLAPQSPISNPCLGAPPVSHPTPPHLANPPASSFLPAIPRTSSTYTPRPPPLSPHSYTLLNTHTNTAHDVDRPLRSPPDLHPRSFRPRGPHDLLPLHKSYRRFIVHPHKHLPPGAHAQVPQNPLQGSRSRD